MNYPKRGKTKKNIWGLVLTICRLYGREALCVSHVLHISHLLLQYQIKNRSQSIMSTTPEPPGNDSIVRRSKEDVPTFRFLCPHILLRVATCIGLFVKNTKLIFCVCPNYFNSAVDEDNDSIELDGKL